MIDEKIEASAKRMVAMFDQVKQEVKKEVKKEMVALVERVEARLQSRMEPGDRGRIRRLRAIKNGIVSGASTQGATGGPTTMWAEADEVRQYAEDAELSPDAMVEAGFALEDA